MALQISFDESDTEADYSLTLRNKSKSSWTFYVYQKLPNTTSGAIFSLVWVTSPGMIPVGAQVNFQWKAAYNFVWGETGSLHPGAIFYAGQVIDANPEGANKTTFSANPTPSFSPPVMAPPAGSLIIACQEVLSDLYSVGIGMAGFGTYVAQAASNLNFQFTPATPSYWIGFETDIRTGTVLDLGAIPDQTEVIFPPDVFSATRTLNEAGKWV